MSVKPGDLENAERDLELTNRDPKGMKKVLADLQRVKTAAPTSDEELKALRDRIAAGLVTVGKDPQPHCGDCWKRGWIAALQSLKE